MRPSPPVNSPEICEERSRAISLPFAGAPFRTELTVDGTQMRGTRQGGGIPPREIRLLKK